MITDEEIYANEKKIVRLLRSTERESIEHVIGDMRLNGYFTSPASTRYHMSCTGGLAKHSLNVYETLDMLNKYSGSPIPDDSVKLIALLHDYDKQFVYQEKRLKNGELAKTPFEKKDSLPLGHGEKSVILLQKLIELTTLEQMCIRWHMGNYDKSFREKENIIKTNYPEVMLVYFADHISSLMLE